MTSTRVSPIAVQRYARRGECRHAQVRALRERLLKLGVWIRTTTRRIVLHLPDKRPEFDVLLVA